MRNSLDPFHVYVLLLTVGLLLVFGLPGINAFIKDSVSIAKVSESSKSSSTDASQLVSADIPEENGSTNELPGVTQIEKESSSAQDKEAHQVYYWNLPLLISIYATRNGYPVASTQGWRVFLDSLRTPIIDPYTNKEPAFTTQTPKVGEVQYITPGTCKRDVPELENLTIKNSYAYRSFVAGKMMCSGNLIGYVD